MGRGLVYTLVLGGFALGCGARTSVTQGSPIDLDAAGDGGRGVDGTSPPSEASTNPPDAVVADASADAPREASPGPDASCPAPDDSCGDTCAAGQCLSGRCLVSLATDQAPLGMAVDPNAVYWTNAGRHEGSVKSVPLTGGAVTTLVPSTFDPQSIAVDDTRVYWVNSGEAGEILAVALDGGTPTQIFGGLGVGGFTGIAVSEGEIYWTRLESGEGLFSAPTDGGTQVHLWTGHDAMDPVLGDGVVYWSSLEGVQALALPAAPRPSPLTLTAGPAGGIALDDAGGVYLTAGGEASFEGEILRVPSTGGSAISLATHQQLSGALATDGEDVYWTNDGEDDRGKLRPRTGSVVRVPVHGGTPTTLVCGEDDPTAISVDRDGITWITRDAVRRLSPK